MLHWLNNKHPEFWKKYTSSFKEKSNKYVILGIETTGLNAAKDSLVAVAAIGVLNDKISVKDTLEVYVSQPQTHAEANQNEFSVYSKKTKITENEAIEMLLNFIGNATIIGHRIHQDIEVLNARLSKLGCGKLKNEALDIEIMFNKAKETVDKKYTVDEMCTYFSIPITDSLSVADAGFSIAILFLKLKAILSIK